MSLMVTKGRTGRERATVQHQGGMGPLLGGPGGAGGGGGGGR